MGYMTEQATLTSKKQAVAVPFWVNCLIYSGTNLFFSFLFVRNSVFSVFFGVPTCLQFRCLDRQILFEKELWPLARCFGKSEIKVLLGSMQNLILLNRIKIRVHVLETSSELDVLWRFFWFVTHVKLAATKSQCELSLERKAPWSMDASKVSSAQPWSESLPSVEYQLFVGFWTERCERHVEERCTWGAVLVSSGTREGCFSSLKVEWLIKTWFILCHSVWSHSVLPHQNPSATLMSLAWSGVHRGSPWSMDASKVSSVRPWLGSACRVSNTSSSKVFELKDARDMWRSGAPEVWCSWGVVLVRCVSAVWR